MNCAVAANFQLKALSFRSSTSGGVARPCPQQRKQQQQQRRRGAVQVAAGISFDRHLASATGSRRSIACQAAEGEAMQKGERDDFIFYYKMPSKGIEEHGIADCKLAPILASSELVIVRYDIPFGLDAAPDAASGQILVTKDAQSPQIEKTGDILRQATYWQGKRPMIIDVSKNAAEWDLIVKALMTNTKQVTEDIVMVFERPNLSERIFLNVDVCIE